MREPSIIECRDSVKKGELSQTHISSSAFSGVTINNTSLLSAMNTLALESTCLYLRLYLLANFFIFSVSPDRANFTFTSVLPSFSIAGTRTRLLSSKSRAVVHIKTSFEAFSTNSLILEIIFERPLSDPESS